MNQPVPSIASNLIGPDPRIRLEVEGVEFTAVVGSSNEGSAVTVTASEVKAADRLGVAYTPNEIVRFMVESADWLCQKHFGKGLGSGPIKGIHKAMVV